MADDTISREEYLERVRNDGRLIVVESLKKRRTLAAVEQVAEAAVEFADGVAAILSETVPPKRPLACKEGCAFCCSLPVAVSPQEVIRIAQHLRATRSPEELSALRRRVVEAEERRRDPSAGLGPGGTECPLLDGNRCSVYALRPLSCRACNSYDVKACERQYWTGRGTTPAYDVLQEIHAAVLSGVLSGVGEVKLDAEPLELIAALRLALEEPAVPGRWLKGEPAWKPAHFADVLPDTYRESLGGPIERKPTGSRR